MKKISNNIINLKAFREDTEKYIGLLDKGQSFVVYKRSKPVFELRPAYEEGRWETVVDFTKLRRGGVDIKDILSRI